MFCYIFLLIFLILIFQSSISMSTSLLTYCVKFRLNLVLKLINLIFFCISDWNTNLDNHYIRRFSAKNLACWEQCTKIVFVTSFLIMKTTPFLLCFYDLNTVYDLIGNVQFQFILIYCCLEYQFVHSFHFFTVLNFSVLISYEICNSVSATLIFFFQNGNINNQMYWKF